MPKHLFVQNITEEELSELQSFKQQGAREFVRGRIIELSASGKQPKEISESVGLSVGRVREWIRRFNRERLAGLVPRKHQADRGSLHGIYVTWSEPSSAMLQMSMAFPRVDGL